MSRPHIHITIPKPCHERWESMDATEQGAFCHSCQKEVIDFSAMTDREVIEYISKHQTGCGRFRKDQVDTKLTIPELNNGWFKWRALLLGLLPIFVFEEMKAASSQAGIEQIKIPYADQKDTSAVAATDSIHISGKVVDEQGEGLIAASVEILRPSGESTHIGTSTDIDGNFDLIIDSKLAYGQSYKLKATYVGYEIKTIAISNKAVQNHIKLSLIARPFLLGEIEFKPRTPAGKLKYWFRHTFAIKKHRS